MVQDALQGAQGASQTVPEIQPPGSPASQGASPISAFGQNELSEISQLRPTNLPQGLDISSFGTPVGMGQGGGGGGGNAGVLELGNQYLGTKYTWGGTTPQEGFDCSGLVQYLYGKKGINLPRTSIEQSKVGQEVNGLGSAQPGDLVFWHGQNGRPNHIGIYAGNGKMLEAPNKNATVRYRDITKPPDTIRRVG